MFHQFDDGIKIVAVYPGPGARLPSGRASEGPWLTTRDVSGIPADDISPFSYIVDINDHDNNSRGMSDFCVRRRNTLGDHFFPMAPG